MKIVILGLSITSSWGNGHAVTYRSIVKALSNRGHEVLFLERDQPWYASNRDLPMPPYGTTHLYDSVEELSKTYCDEIICADILILGSYVPEAIAIGNWLTENATGIVSFYDIDTPVTLAQLENQDCSYMTEELIPRYDLYLTFTGGPTMRKLKDVYGAKVVKPLYCSVDPDEYYPGPQAPEWDLGYMGTYSMDRQPSLEKFLIQPATDSPEKKMIVAGPKYPASVSWPENVTRVDHIPPSDHRKFYNSQRFTLNVTRSAMIAAGYSPSIRLFEAAACGTPIISDNWEGLEEFFEPGKEILVVNKSSEVTTYLNEIDDETRQQIGSRARERTLSAHTCNHRAIELEQYWLALR